MGPATCGRCRRFSPLGEGRLVGNCTAGPRKAHGKMPCVSASMGAGGCPDYMETSGRELRARSARRAAQAMGGSVMGSLDRLEEALFAELDRLGALDLKDSEGVDAEIERARTMCKVSGAITANHGTAMQAARLQSELGLGKVASMPRLLVGDDG